MDDTGTGPTPEQEWCDLLDVIVAAGPLDAWHADAFSDSTTHGCADTTDAEHPLDAIPPFREAPGVALVTALASTRVQTLTSTQAIEFVRATEEAIAWLGAMQADAIIAVAGPRSRVDEYAVPGGRRVNIEDAARSELAAATGWSESWAHDRITTARLLNDPLPQTREALASGAISLRHADAIVSAARRCSGFVDWVTGAPSEAATTFTRACAILEGVVVPVARDSGVASTRRAADRAINRVDADNAAQRRKREHRGRDVTVYEKADGISVLVARLATEQAHACLSAIDRLARDRQLPLSSGTPTDAGIGERRAEALVQLVLRGRKSGDHAQRASGRPSPIRAHVDVVIDLATLIGLADTEGSLRCDGPGGPVPIAGEAVRQLVCGDPTATMRRLVTDPLTGHLLDRGRTTYQVPDRLRDFIASRDETCRFPGCNRRAGLAQVDHAVPWDEGGTTDRANLGALCVRHHQLKTHHG